MMGEHKTVRTEGPGPGRWRPATGRRPLLWIFLLFAGVIAPGLTATATAAPSSGVLYSRGSGAQGELGTGSSADTAVAAPVSNLTPVPRIAAGGSFGLAQQTDGTVWSWGANLHGQLGNGTSCAAATCGNPTPAQIAGLSGVTAVAGGEYHSLALRGDGTVWAWGDNGEGQIGIGSTCADTCGVATPTQVKDPTDATGFLTGVTAIAADRWR